MPDNNKQCEVVGMLTKISSNKAGSYLAIVLITLIFAILSLPTTSEAVTLETVWNKIKSIFTNVDKILDEIEAGTDLINTTQIKILVATTTDFMEVGLPIPPGDWESSLCPAYKTALQDFISELSVTGDQLFSLTGTTVANIDIEILSNALEDLPCFILYPSYAVLEQGPLSQGPLGVENSTNNLINLRGHLADVADLLVPPSKTAPLLMANSEEFDIYRPFSCTVYEASGKDPIDYARYSVTGIGIFLRIVGTILKAAGKTVIAGPTEAHGGAAGFAGATIKHNTVGALGQLVDGIGEVVMALMSSLGDLTTNCRLVFAFEEINDQVRQHDTDIKEKIVTHDTDIKEKIVTHDTDIKALLANVKEGQQELIRLLLTPQGKRKSEFCTGVDCDFPVKP
jgi:hypothetical protein